MHYLAAAFIGVIAAILAENAKISPMSIGDGMEPFLIFVLTMIFLLCLKRRLAMPIVLYGTVSGLSCVGLCPEHIFCRFAEESNHELTFERSHNK